MMRRVQIWLGTTELTSQSLWLNKLLSRPTALCILNINNIKLNPLLSATHCAFFVIQHPYITRLNNRDNHRRQLYRDVANLGKRKPNRWRPSKWRPRQLRLSGKQKAANFVGVKLHSYVNSANRHTPNNWYKKKTNVTRTSKWSK